MNNAAVSLFPDYSVAVRNQSAQFQQIKQKLREYSVQYAMLVPATLHVIYKGKTHFFQSPKEVLMWWKLLLRLPQLPS